MNPRSPCALSPDMHRETTMTSCRFTVLAAAAALTFTSAPVLAQSNWSEVSDAARVEAFDMSADATEDLDVVDASGNKIGEVEDVLSKGADPEALGVEFEGISDYSPKKDVDVVIPLDRFTLDGERLKLDASAEEVEAMETYDD